MRYFAYGSNMLRARLEARVGGVVVLGRAELRGWCHRFDKRGHDGTGKGNIVRASRHIVHGVVYQLTALQLERLAVFEGGYRRIELELHHAELGCIAAHAFTAVAPVCGLRPTPEYLDYYERGMIEHGLPAAYCARVLSEGRRVSPGKTSRAARARVREQQ